MPVILAAIQRTQLENRHAAEPSSVLTAVGLDSLRARELLECCIYLNRGAAAGGPAASRSPLPVMSMAAGEAGDGLEVRLEGLWVG